MFMVRNSSQLVNGIYLCLSDATNIGTHRAMYLMQVHCCIWYSPHPNLIQRIFMTKRRKVSDAHKQRTYLRMGNIFSSRCFWCSELWCLKGHIFHRHWFYDFEYFCQNSMLSTIWEMKRKKQKKNMIIIINE